MKEEIQQIQADALAAIEAATDEATLDQAKVDFLGKKGRLTGAAGAMRTLSKEEKPAAENKPAEPEST